MIAKNDRIIVKKVKIPEKTKGGLYVPESAKDKGKLKMNVGTVVSFGKGYRGSNGEYVTGYDGEVGDYVVWEHFGDFAIDVLGEDLFGIRAEDVLCSLDEEERKMFVEEEPDNVDTTDAPIAEETKREKELFCYGCGNEWTEEVESIKSDNPPCPRCASKDTSTNMRGARPLVGGGDTPRFHR